MTILTTITGSPAGIPFSKSDDTVPFKSAEEAWFWFIQAQTARNEGAKISAGAGLYSRPCEPVDIIQALERLYRARSVTMDHIMILRHYGQRLLSPDPRRQKEMRAYALWKEALEKLEDALVKKRIVVRPHWIKFSDLWPSVDALAHKTEVIRIDLPDHFKLVQWLESQGETVVAYPIKTTKLKPLTPSIFSCVESVKRILGLRKPFILTPWQLYQFIKERNS